MFSVSKSPLENLLWRHIPLALQPNQYFMPGMSVLFKNIIVNPLTAVGLKTGAVALMGPGKG